MASIDRTAYLRFKRVVSGRELVEAFTPTPAEITWARGKTQNDQHLLALVVRPKSYQRLLLPVFAALPQPLALLEVGAAAGLGLYPYRYTYRYGDHEIGTGGPVLDCALTGTAPPARLPEVVWRAGLDLNPLRVTDPADVAWLEALIWPEHHHRRERLRAAAAVAAADPPILVRGDLVVDLPALAARAPADATLVVFHTSVLYQVPAERRQAFASLVRDLPGHWISVEAPDVLRHGTLPPAPDQAAHNVLALDGVPLAWTRSHGQAMAWFG